MAKPTLIYFAARGRAELLRILLHEAGVDYHEHPATKGGPAQDGRATDLAALTASGDLPFAAVPVWEEPDGFRVAQNNAIVNYIAATHGLRGKDAREAALVDEMIGAFDDVRGELRRLLIVPAEQRAAVRQELVEKTLPRWTGFLERLLVRNHGGDGYLVGDALTVADLALWYTLELINDYRVTSALEHAPKLRAYFDRLSARPSIRAYVTSPRRHPLLPPPA
jgi:glutathione S-transferase